MRNITVGGNVGSTQEVTEVKGVEVFNFTLAVKNGFGSDADTVWIKCAVWGKRAASLSKMIEKGARVVVQGSFTLETYNEQASIRVRVEEVFLSGGRQGGTNFGASRAPSPESLDDAVPF